MEKTNPELSVIVCDAGPIIHLFELECLDLLNDFSRIILPESVIHEVQLHSSTALTHPNFVWEMMNARTKEKPEIETLAMIFSLHQGERDALHIMQDFPNAFFLTDDTAARFAARSMGLNVHGTIGIILRSIRRKLKTREEVIDILKSVPERSTLFIKPKLLEEIIHQIKSGAENP